MAEPVAARHRAGDEGERALGRVEPRRLGEEEAGVGERGDHQPVPVGEHLVVEAGPYARVADAEKFCAQRREPRVVVVAARLRVEAVEDVVALEIARRRHVIVPRKKLAVLDAELAHHLIVRPDIELALLAFGIGVERGGKRAVRARHLALEPFHRFAGALAIERLAGLLVRERQKFEELGVVVEHLLEMRREPALVDRVAGKAAAEVVVDAALADVVERDLDRSEEARPLLSLPRWRERVGRGLRRPARQSSSNRAACGNFGAPRVPPLTGSIRPPSCSAALSSSAAPMTALPFGRAVVGEPRHQRCAVLLDLLRLFAEHPRALRAARRRKPGRP